MKFIVLAAGYATRLYPLTENFPKPLLKVQGKSILDRLVDDIAQSGQDGQITVVSNAKFFPVFSAWASKRPENIKILNDGSLTNQTRLGAVKDILFALETLNMSGNTMVMAADNLLEFSLSIFLDYCKKKAYSSVMRYWEPDHKKLLNCGVVVIDKDDRVLSMTEKDPHPVGNWCCPPFYYYNKLSSDLVRQAIKEGCPTDSPGSLMCWFSKQNRVYAMKMPARRYDIGSLESYEEVKLTYKPPRL